MIQLFQAQDKTLFNDFKMSVRREIVSRISVLPESYLLIENRSATLYSFIDDFRLVPIKLLDGHSIDIQEIGEQYKNNSCTIFFTLPFEGSKILWTMETHECEQELYVESIGPNSIIIKITLESLDKDAARHTLDETRKKIERNLQIQSQIVLSHNRDIALFINEQILKRAAKYEEMRQLRFALRP